MAHFGAMMAVVALAGLGQEPGLLGDSVDWREIPFAIVEAKPLIEARVSGTPGRMMFDTGTPLTVLVNRDAVALEGGHDSRTGSVASGQSVDIRNHAPVPIEFGGVAIAAGPVLISGDFGFIEVAFGEDFLGFVGTPAVEEGAFLLDYSRQVLTILRTDADGALVAGPPASGEVVARFSFVRDEGEQPTTGAFIGSLPIVLDFDTGDSGTLYLRPETRASLEAEGVLAVEGDEAVLRALRLGGAVFADVTVRIIEAGGAEDGRTWSGSNSLRLGAGFLSEHPSLWNYPAGTITILEPGAAFLAPR